jgi:hypothetical protein
VVVRQSEEEEGLEVVRSKVRGLRFEKEVLDRQIDALLALEREISDRSA